MSCVLQFICWYCLPDSRSPLVCSPETSSRVTLASLGIAFQAKLAYSVHSVHSCSLSPITCFFLNTEIFLVDGLVAHSFYLWGEMMVNRLISVLFRFFILYFFVVSSEKANFALSNQIRAPLFERHPYLLRASLRQICTFKSETGTALRATPLFASCESSTNLHFQIGEGNRAWSDTTIGFVRGFDKFALVK